MAEFNLGQLILDAAWLLLLLGMFYHFWQSRQLLVHAQSWLKVKGHITRCHWVKTGHNIWPEIEYSYQVYDTDLIGRYLFLDTTHNNPNSKYARGIAYKAAVAFQEGTEIEIYYNPNHPEQSALDVTIPTKLNIILIVVGILTLIHIGSMVLRFLH